MKYLYGDATPFPLDENFIEVICAVTDACVALFRIDVEQAERYRKSHEAARHADEELAHLKELAKAVEAALKPLIPQGETTHVSEGAAKKIAQFAGQAIQQARMGVLRERDQAARGLSEVNHSRRIMKALSPLVLHHELPQTQWTATWASGKQAGDAQLELCSASGCRLRCTYQADIPETSQWYGPVRIEDLDPSVRIELQTKGGWLRRGSSGGRKAIHRFFITRVESAPENAWLELRQNAQKASMGYDISVSGRDQSGPVIYPVDSKGERAEPLTLAGDEAEPLFDLWTTIRHELSTLVPRRCELQSASFAGKDIAEIKEPAAIAEGILTALAPIIRQIRVRSRVPGELVLKRDLGDGRREELFVPRTELEKKFSILPYEYRACFNAVGLGGEATSDFVRRDAAPPPVPGASGDTLPGGMAKLDRARRIATASDPDEPSIVIN